MEIEEEVNAWDEFSKRLVREVHSYAQCKARHNKTGNIYNILFMNAIECTNGQEDILKVIYERDGMIFVREKQEFLDKFTLQEN